jgi:hypothetical protein
VAVEPPLEPGSDRLRHPPQGEVRQSRAARQSRVAVRQSQDDHRDPEALPDWSASDAWACAPRRVHLGDAGYILVHRPLVLPRVDHDRRSAFPAE